MDPNDGQPASSSKIRRTIVEPIDDGDATDADQSASSTSSPQARKTLVEPVDSKARQTLAEPADSKVRRTLVEPAAGSEVKSAPAAPASPRPASGASIRRTIVEPIDEAAPSVAAPSVAAAKQPGPTQPAQTQAEATGSRAVAFRPTLRPPMAVLYVLDDGGTTAETIRIRTDTFRIGRSKGDLRIPHDAQLSGEHMEISREFKDNKWSWLLKDLNSTNGLFVRVSQAILEDGQELILGGRRYCFRQETGEQTSRANDIRGTIVSGRVGRTASGPTLEEVMTEGFPPRIQLNAAEQWLGHDPSQCDIALDDPMLDAQDARIYRNERDEWFVERGNSLNGVWARVESIAISGRGVKFQCGEQRFELRWH